MPLYIGDGRLSRPNSVSTAIWADRIEYSTVNTTSPGTSQYCPTNAKFIAPCGTTAGRSEIFLGKNRLVIYGVPHGIHTALPSIASLGIDALSPKLTQKHFQGLLSEKKKRPIGVVLLEQDLIAGIGNIYRSEALFLAGVLPTRRIETLTKKEWLKILPAIKKVLQRAVKLRGTSDGDFRDTDGLEGRFQRMLHVYGRTGKSCKKCDTIILRKKIGQRSVFYCPRCQK